MHASINTSMTPIRASLDLILPPEGLGARLASSGPFFYPRIAAGTRGLQVLIMNGTNQLKSGFTGTQGVALAGVPAGCCWLARVCCLVALIGLAACQPDALERSPSGDTVGSGSTTDIPIKLQGGIEVAGARDEVRVPAVITLDEGWLEVIACIEGTREHESIVVSSVVPSVVHAALLLIGVEPGRPAGWDSGTNTPIPPEGGELEVFVAWMDPTTGEPVEHPVQDLLFTERSVSPPGFVFAGSMVAPNPPSLGPGEHYVADYAGTIVGLATFGDELVAAREVLSPEEAVEPRAWRVRSGILPPPGSAATLILRRPSERSDGPEGRRVAE